MTKKQPAGVSPPSQPGVAQVDPADFAGLPAELAQQAVHLHCAMVWPAALPCSTCQNHFRNWGLHILRQASWTEAQIAALTPTPHNEKQDDSRDHPNRTPV